MDVEILDALPDELVFSVGSDRTRHPLPAWGFVKVDDYDGLFHALRPGCRPSGLMALATIMMGAIVSKEASLLVIFTASQ